jgi:hypothetical protein
MQRSRNRNRNQAAASERASLALIAPAPASRDALVSATKSAVLNEISQHLNRDRIVGAGRAVGSFLGAPLIGGAAGSIASKILGYGDYQYGPPTLAQYRRQQRNRQRGQSIPGYVSNDTWPQGGRGGNASRGPRIRVNRNAITVTHSEYICDVLGLIDNVFDNQVLDINPSNAKTFPWLSQIAPNFDQWRAIRINFRYVSNSAAFNGESQSLGGIVLAPEYDVRDSPATSRSAIENAENSVSGRPSRDLACGLECKKRMAMFGGLLKTGAAPSEAERQQYDMAYMQVGTFGVDSSLGPTVTLGSLYVDYTIQFEKKQLNPTVPFTFFTYTTGMASDTSARAFRPTSTVVCSQPVAYVTDDIVEVPVPPGTYIVTYSVSGTGVAVATPSLTMSDAYGQTIATATDWTSTTSSTARRDDRGLLTLPRTASSMTAVYATKTMTSTGSFIVYFTPVSDDVTSTMI